MYNRKTLCRGRVFTFYLRYIIIIETKCVFLKPICISIIIFAIINFIMNVIIHELTMKFRIIKTLYYISTCFFKI